MPIRLLLAEDSEDDAVLVLRALRQAGYDVTHERVESAAVLIAALERATWDAVLCDYTMPGFGGLDALRIVRERDRNLPFIFVSGSIGEQTAVAAMRAGAQDYVLKGNIARLAPALTRELGEAKARRQLEAQLLQARKMEAMGRLAGGVAHDFNNMLTVISSNAEFLLDDLAVDDRRRDDVLHIRVAAEQATQLSRQLLMFTRSEVLKAQVVRVDAVVADAAKFLGRLIGSDIELIVNLGGKGALVEVDPGLLMHAVINLAINARDAMPGGGKLLVETHVTPDEIPLAVLAVSDTGAGMDAATQARMFEPFFTTKATGNGTGLGLSQVYTVIERYRGAVGVRTEPGTGTTVELRLPCTFPTAANSSELEAPRVASSTGETVLILEDAAARTMTRHVLERSGYRVIEASDGLMALHVAERHHGPIQLVVADTDSLAMSCPDFVGQLTRVRPDIRALLVSGDTDEAIANPGTLGERVHHLYKPFTGELFTRKVRAAIDAH